VNFKTERLCNSISVPPMKEKEDPQTKVILGKKFAGAVVVKCDEKRSKREPEPTMACERKKKGM